MDGNAMTFIMTRITRFLPAHPLICCKSFGLELLFVTAGGKHGSHRVRELLREPGPSAEVHRRRSPAGLPGLAADGDTALPQWTV